MTNFLLYLIETSVIFASLFVIYQLFLSRLTFHSLNRVILLSLIPISLTLPLIELGNFHTIAINHPENFIFYEDVFLGVDSDSTAVETQSRTLSIGFLLGLVYLIGCILRATRILLIHLKLWRTKKQSEVFMDEQFHLISAKVPVIFSYFNWIFIPLEMKGKCQKEVISHEKQHCRHGHTLDLFISECFSALLWFNPLVYFFHKSLKTVHEYQIDAHIINQQSKTSDYLNVMLQHLNQEHRLVGVYSYFNGITLKKRIQMMTKNNSKKRQLVRYTLILPLVALFSLSFAMVEESNNDSSTVATSPKISETPSIFPVDINGFKRTASPYGERINPITKEKVFHSGFDIVAKKGTSIYASADGVILKAFADSSYGKYVIIKHGQTFETFYAHMSSFIVEEGQQVSKGEVIGYVGDTGRSTGDHLHYEVRVNGKHINPALYMPKRD